MITYGQQLRSHATLQNVVDIWLYKLQFLTWESEMSGHNRIKQTSALDLGWQLQGWEPVEKRLQEKEAKGPSPSLHGSPPSESLEVYSCSAGCALSSQLAESRQYSLSLAHFNSILTKHLANFPWTLCLISELCLNYSFTKCIRTATMEINFVSSLQKLCPPFVIGCFPSPGTRKVNLQ